MPRKSENMSDKRYGRLVVIGKEEHPSTAKRRKLICLCDCGNTCLVRRDSLVDDAIVSCGCYKDELSRKRRGKNHPKFTGFEEISGEYWGSLVDRAKRRSHQLDITAEEAWQIYLVQDKKCALSGLPICFSSRYDPDTEMTASIDRIDSNKGYTKDNVQWLHKLVNRMKMNLDEDVFIQFCRTISANNPPN